MTLQTRQEAALEPVRAAMLKKARKHAAETVAKAREAAEAMITLAQRDADLAVARAREDGIAQAEPIAMAELSRSRQASRTVTLGAEAAIRDEVVRRIKDVVLALRDEPGYPLLRERLSALAARTAGPGAVLSEHELGGLVARADGVTVDCSLPRLAEAVVEKLDARIAALCLSSDPPRPGQGDS